MAFLVGFQIRFLFSRHFKFGFCSFSSCFQCLGLALNAVEGLQSFIDEWFDLCSISILIATKANSCGWDICVHKNKITLNVKDCVLMRIDCISIWFSFQQTFVKDLPFFIAQSLAANVKAEIECKKQKKTILFSIQIIYFRFRYFFAIHLRSQGNNNIWPKNKMKRWKFSSFTEITYINRYKIVTEHFVILGKWQRSELLPW